MSRFQKTVMIDCAAIGHYMKYSLRNLKSGDDNTGVIFGFLGFVRDIAVLMNPSQFVFAWDSRRSHRKRLYPNYKGNRSPHKKTEEEQNETALMRQQLSILQSTIIPEMGFSNSFLSIGREADDIIAACCLSTPGKKVIVSRDNDLFQLLDQETRMWDFQKRKYFTADDFRDKWGIEPHEWKIVKTIAGCGGDNVPNVPGVKETTAIKYMKGELPEFNKDGKTPNKQYKAIQENADLIKNNGPLVILPFKDTPRYQIKKDHVSIEAFWAICEEYEFNSFLDDIEEWVEALKMT